VNIDKKIRIRSSYELNVRKHEFLKICNLLDELNIRYYLQHGILLGAIRNNDFIPWDWDVEFCVLNSDILKKFDQLIKSLKVSGFKILKFKKDITSLKIDFLGKLPSETTIYTIQGWNHDKKKKIFWRSYQKFPDFFFKKMKKIKLFDKYHLAPHPPESYLKYTYGNWKKPLRTSNKFNYIGIKNLRISLNLFKYLYYEMINYIKK
jgi:hypothetical protein